MIIVGKKLKVTTDEYIKSIEEGIKKLFKLMKVTETKKVNIFELFLLMIIMSRSIISVKMKMMLCLLDFEKKKILSADVLNILSTLFVVAVSRIFTIKMNSFTNKDLLEFVQTLGEA